MPADTTYSNWPAVTGTYRNTQPGPYARPALEASFLVSLEARPSQKGPPLSSTSYMTETSADLADEDEEDEDDEDEGEDDEEDEDEVVLKVLEAVLYILEVVNGVRWVL